MFSQTPIKAMASISSCPMPHPHVPGIHSGPIQSLYIGWHACMKPQKASRTAPDVMDWHVHGYVERENVVYETIYEIADI